MGLLHSRARVRDLVTSSLSAARATHIGGGGQGGRGVSVSQGYGNRVSVGVPTGPAAVTCTRAGPHHVITVCCLCHTHRCAVRGVGGGAGGGVGGLGVRVCTDMRYGCCVPRVRDLIASSLSAARATYIGVPFGGWGWGVWGGYARHGIGIALRSLYVYILHCCTSLGLSLCVHISR